MPVPTLISELSQTPASNSPVGTVDVPSSIDDYQRTHAAFIATLRDGKGFTSSSALASGATTDIGSQNALFVDISGTTTITSFGTNFNGPRFLRFAGALTLTHHATNLVLPGGVNITTAAGDTLLVIPKTTAAVVDGWIVIAYQRNSGVGVAASELQNQTFTAYTTAGTSTAYTLTPSPAITAYAANQSFFVNFNAASGAAPTLAISALGSPPNLVKQIGDGTYANIAAGDIPINHRSRVTLLSTTQALVEKLPAPAQTLTSGTAVAASGTAVDFTGIPAWAKRIVINFAEVSTNGTSNWLFQIGDSGGIETSGYLGAGTILENAAAISGANFTAGFGIPFANAANSASGSIVLSLTNSINFLWAASGVFSLSNVAATVGIAGSKALSAALDRVRITTAAGVDTFDTGTINILYE